MRQARRVGGVGRAQTSTDERGESGGESGTTKWRTGRFLLSKTTTKEEEHHLHRILSAWNDRPRDKNTKL